MMRCSTALLRSASPSPNTKRLPARRFAIRRYRKSRAVHASAFMVSAFVPVVDPSRPELPSQATRAWRSSRRHQGTSLRCAGRQHRLPLPPDPAPNPCSGSRASDAACRCSCGQLDTVAPETPRRAEADGSPKRARTPRNAVASPHADSPTIRVPLTVSGCYVNFCSA